MQRPKHAPDLAWRAVGDFTVIIQLGAERLFHELDEVGSAIWTRCDGNRSTDEIAHEIESEYEVDPATARRDVSEFVTELGRMGLIQWSS